jgi:hypothetical protein
MSRLTTEGRLAATTLRDRAGAAAVPGPYLVLDLGRGRGPQARCRRCHWRSSWRTTAAHAQAEHARHQAATHGRGPARRGRLRLLIRRRAR